MIQFDWSEHIQNWAYKSWRKTQGDGVKIAVLDTGVDLAHAALKRLDQPGHKINAAVPGFDPNRLSDFWSGDVMDKHRQKGHGTQCVSVLSSAPEGENLVKGITPKAEVFIIKVNTVDHKFFLVKDFLKGLEAAAKLKVEVIISSICFPEEDIEAENIPREEVERVFGLVRQSGAMLFAALPNMPQHVSWTNLAKSNYPCFWENTVNIGAISAAVFNSRRTEIDAEPGIYFLASDAKGTFCKINREYTDEQISSSYGVYIVAAVAVLYLSYHKKKEKENYQPRQSSEFLSSMSRLFRPLMSSEPWDSSQLVLYRTSALAV